MAKSKYTRIKFEERELIYKSLAEGKSQSDIAKKLDRDPSVISREIRRDSMDRNTYRPSRADIHAKLQSLKRKKKYKLVENQNLAKIIEDKIKLRWSPEQVSGTLKKLFPKTPSLHISHETIYRYIYSIKDKEHRESLISGLRRNRKRRRLRKEESKNRTSIRNLISIHQRPKEVEGREEPGHWEGDLIIGKDHKSAIGTLVERTTRFTIIVSLQGERSSKAVCQAFAAVFGVLPSHMKKSVTYDRGSEMSGHQWLTRVTGVPVFFADAYCSWQRGTNENTNGLIRDYLPKKTDFRKVTDRVLLDIQNALNERPRKTLEYFSPSEIFQWFLENPERNVHDFYGNICQMVM